MNARLFIAFADLGILGLGGPTVAATWHVPRAGRDHRRRPGRRTAHQAIA